MDDLSVLPTVRGEGQAAPQAGSPSAGSTTGAGTGPGTALTPSTVREDALAAASAPTVPLPRRADTAPMAAWPRAVPPVPAPGTVRRRARLVAAVVRTAHALCTAAGDCGHVAGRAAVRASRVLRALGRFALSAAALLARSGPRLARLARAVALRAARSAGPPLARRARRTAAGTARAARLVAVGTTRATGRGGRRALTAARAARAAVARRAARLEEWMRVRLDITLRAPGRGGRIFLTVAGSAVVLIAISSVVLGIQGGPAMLRPLADPPSPSPLAAPVAASAAPTPTEVPGEPVAATGSYLLTAYAAGSGHVAAVTPAPDTVVVGRQYQHTRRRGEDHLLTAELVFPLLPVPARCLGEVQLRLTLVSSDGLLGNEAPYPLAVYPSALTSLAVGRVPGTVPRLDLVANRPRGDVRWNPYQLVDDDSGTGVYGQSAPPDGQELSADITELYRAWAAGMPSESGQPAVAPGTALVLAVRPAYSDVLGTWRHLYAGSATDTPPTLAWTRRAHCAPDARS